jgi:hypothetical protein
MLALADALSFVRGDVYVPDVIWAAVTHDTHQLGALDLLAWRQDLGARLAIVWTENQFDRLQRASSGSMRGFGAHGRFEIPRTRDLGSDAVVIVSESPDVRALFAADEVARSPAVSVKELLLALETQGQLYSADAILDNAERAWAAGFTKDLAQPLPAAVHNDVVDAVRRGLSQGRLWIRP